MTPLFLFTCFSYLSFFLARGAAPARVAMTIISTLVASALINSTINTLPHTDGFIWIKEVTKCALGFSTYAVIEFAAVNFIGRVNARVNAARKAFDAKNNEEDNLGGLPPQMLDTVEKRRTTHVLKSAGKMAWLLLRRDGSAQLIFNDKHIDIMSRWLYPIAVAVVSGYYHSIVANEGLRA